MPTQDSAALSAPPRPATGGTRASSPPAENSHARVGVMKYAAAGFAAVWRIE